MQLARIVRQGFLPMIQSSLQSTRMIRPCTVSAFSTKAANALQNATKAASEVLGNELKFEHSFMEENKSQEEVSLKTYMKNNGCELVEKDGEALFILSSKQGDLQVNILCDARQIYLDEDRFEDEFEEEVDGDEASSGKDDSNQHNLEKDDVEDGEDTEQPIMIRVEIMNKKSQKLTFDANLGREHLAINALHATNAAMDPPSDVPYLSGPTRNLATFTGPNFLDLSEDMQEAFTNYLHSVGVDATLYEALREHLTTKEHKEYVAWLNTLNSFIGGK